MRNFSKKFLAILLTLCMLAAMMPFSVLAAENTAEVAGQQLMLGDDLTMHFYVKTEAANATAVIAVGGVERAAYSLAELTAGENGYDLSVDLAAAEMTEDIGLTVNDGTGDILTRTYSVQDYAHYLLENNYTDETKALAKEMLNYGAKAQLYFGHKTGDLANAGYEMETEAEIPAEAPALEVSDSLSGMSFYGASMVFRSKIAVRFYFNAENGVDGYTFAVEGKTFTDGEKNGNYYIEIADINPDEMDAVLNVSVTKDDESLSFSYSPMAYIIRMYNKESSSQALKDMLKAANGYFQAAKVFTGVAENRTGSLNFAYRYGTNNLIQVNTNLPASTPIANFTADQNGCSIDQSGNTVQWVGWIGMANADGTIVLTFNFNNAFTYGQSYCLPKGAVFGFTDGSTYKLDRAYTFYWDGQAWSETEPAPQADVLDESNFTGGEVITFADVPADFTNSEKIEEYKGLGFNTSVITEDHIGGYGEGADNYYNVSVVTPEVPIILNLQCHWGTNNLIQIKTNLPTDVPTVDFTTSDNGCNVLQSGAQNVGWIQMNGLVGDVQLLTFHFNSAFEAGQSYTLSKGSVFGFTDGSSYVLGGDYTFTWDGSNWSMTAPEGAPATVTPMMDKLDMQYRYGTKNLIQVNTNLPASTPIANFTADQNGCSIDQSGNTVQWVGWIGMADADGTIVLTFNFNNDFTEGQSYVLPKGAVFGFTDGSKYELDSDYTFTWDGTNWSMSTSTLSFSVTYVNGNTIQLKTNIPTGLTYDNFLLSEAAGKGHNLLLETNAQNVGWFGFSEDANTNAVYFTLNFNSYNKPGTQYILKAGTSLKAGDRTFTTDRDYILTVNNAYLSGIENLDNAGLDVWVRNFTNKTGYFDDAMTKAILLYKEVIDGFYMVDEAFQNSSLLNAAGQQNITTDFDALSADVVGWFNTNFAGKYFHSNHVPISSYDHYGDALTAANADAYRQFLEIYKDKFNKMVNASGSSIGFDNYPFVREQINGIYSGISEYYLQNALIAAQVAGNYDFSLCVQTFEASGKKIYNIDSKRDITSAAEVSLQLYTGMAMGADVFEYFAYNSTLDFKAIMNQDGTKRIYDIVKEGNKALCFADVVNSFTWNGIVTSAGSVNNENDEAFSSVANMVLTNISNGVLDSYSSTDDAVIGCFTKDSLNGYMVVNFNDPKAVTGNNTVTLSFADCTRARVYTEVNGVLTSEVVELANGSYTVTLAPGSGCFVIPA